MKSKLLDVDMNRYVITLYDDGTYRCSTWPSRIDDGLWMLSEGQFMYKNPSMYSFSNYARCDDRHKLAIDKVTKALSDYYADKYILQSDS